ncbi:MAG: MBL fold metallo-hydrolase [Syntrophomonadaceae bacterium]|nr:MBL fold metallo-hydrolase [Syntrophomonadaceae bacterium]
MAVAPLEIGKIKVILGENGGRFPFCNSLFIDDTIKVLVDPGAGPETLQELKKQYPVDLVLNTHYHFDHIAYNYLFDQTKIYLNEREGRCFKDRWEIGERLGMADYYGPGWVKEWIARISRPDTVQSPYSPQNRHEWWLSTARLDGTYSWGEMLDFGPPDCRLLERPDILLASAASTFRQKGWFIPGTST